MFIFKMIKWLEKHRQVSISITFLLAILIFVASSISGITTGDTGTGNLSIIYHFFIFFFFSFFLIISIKGQRKIKLKYVLTTIFISIVYAILDEVHQLFVPLRHASMGDIFTDTLGILVSIIIYLLIMKK